MPKEKLETKTRLTRPRVGKHFYLPSRAKQSFKEECDINTIMRKFQKTGMVDHFNKHQGQYGNFIAAEDYHTSLNILLEADEAFATVPAKIREKFSNDPAKFLEFVQNEKNHDSMIEMGLARPPAAPTAATQAPEPTRPPGATSPPGATPEPPPAGE